MYLEYMRAIGFSVPLESSGPTQRAVGKWPSSWQRKRFIYARRIRFARMSKGFSKKLKNLAASFALHIAHYILCRVHSTLRKTPVMAADLTNGIWTLEEMVYKALAQLPLGVRYG